MFCLWGCTRYTPECYITFDMLALLQILIVSLYVFSICNIDVFAYSAINLMGIPLIMAFLYYLDAVFMYFHRCIFLGCVLKFVVA